VIAQARKGEAEDAAALKQIVEEGPRQREALKRRMGVLAEVLKPWIAKGMPADEKMERAAAKYLALLQKAQDWRIAEAVAGKALGGEGDTGVAKGMRRATTRHLESGQTVPVRATTTKVDKRPDEAPRASRNEHEAHRWADKKYEEFQTALASWPREMMGEPPAHYSTTHEALLEHALHAARLMDEHADRNLVLDFTKTWGQDLDALAAQKVGKSKRRTGYVALRGKVGEDAAKRIIGGSSVKKGAIKGYWRKHPGTGKMEFVGPHHREYSKAEQRRVDEAEAKPTATPNPDLDDRPEYGIGRLPQDAEGDIKENLARRIADERERILRAKAKTPAGTTQGQKAKPGAKCANCGRPAAGWNPGAGQHLCAKHWDEY
jgi:hypothetical protein